MFGLNIRRIFLNSVRAYFAPLTGAYKGILEEVRRTDPWKHHRSVTNKARRHTHSTRS